MAIEVEGMGENFADTRTIEEQVNDFIQKELQALEQQKILKSDNILKAKANAKREYLAHCKRHICGQAVNVMATAEQLIRDGWSIDLRTMQILPGYVDLYLTPPDKVLKAGIRKAQREEVQACRLRIEVELKNALEAIQKAAGELYDKLVVQQLIEEQHRRRDALISKLVIGGK